MAINKVEFGGRTLIDLTDTTATADKILTGYGAYGKDGVWVDGTAIESSPDGSVYQDAEGYVVLDDGAGTHVEVESLSVTENGTYTAPTGYAYSPVSVDVEPNVESLSVTPTEEQQVFDGSKYTEYYTQTFSNYTATARDMSYDEPMVVGYKYRAHVRLYYYDTMYYPTSTIDEKDADITLSESGSVPVVLLDNATQRAIYFYPTFARIYGFSASSYEEICFEVTFYNQSESLDGYLPVTVNAISSTYVGSGITQRSSTDLTASGPTVTVPAGYYSATTNKSVASGNTGIPTATKGTVSNNSISVYTSVTNTTGYITGGTKTGIGVTVSASELVSGSQTITTNDTYDVTNLASVTVNVSGGVTPTGTINITTNGTHDVTNYATANVNVSGGGSTSKKQINFIDYDGTLVQSYSADEWANVTSLPSNPSHTGLVAQGWNWTKAQIDAQLTASPDGDIWIGQMYITESGDTEIDVRFSDSARLSPILAIAVNGTVTVDWGDNTTPDTVTGASLTTRQAVPHIYASTGKYTMVIHVVSGSFQFYGSTGYMLLRKNLTEQENRIYSNCVENVRFGSGVTSIGIYAFYSCFSLESITIPSSVTIIGTQAFFSCYSLVSITIPSGVTSINPHTFYNCFSLANIAIPSNVTSIGNYAFNSCYSLASITIPSDVTSIGNYVFYNCFSLISIAIPSGVTSIGAEVFSSCYSLASITIPNGVTSIGNNAFYSCHSLASIAIPSGVTSIGDKAFYNCFSLASITIPSDVTSIGSYTFFNCYSLASITIPSDVTSIGNYAFSNCYGMAEYHILPTNVPTLGTTAFNNIVSDCTIYVPSGTLSDYQSATNWSTYASYMVEESA